ncbi:ABC transporter ATP-binding protein [Bacteroides propionicifaciens]|jgi:ABC-2 type transport system ATP-binding protein|uniref:ABC transporter ATP-binding protein n=1 Tax=Bacteroides propionicifaciens TaxID=392838 RepID=UPI0003748E6A|nr:ABC transporter ATP-binding protein [Bacteroides propionicifaciens]
MLEINNITKSYNKKEVLNIPSLKIDKGELIGIVGNNGAGKSTLFRLMLDLIAPDTGEIGSKGLLVNKSEDWKTYTGSYVDNTFLLGYLTPTEYLDFLGSLGNMTKEEISARVDRFKNYLGTDNLEGKKYIRNLSSGNQQKVGIVGALFNQPEFVILDEPFNFLDPTAQENTKKLLAKIHSDTETTILVSSHNLEHLLTICTRVILLENGVVIKDVKGDAAVYQEEIMSYFLKDMEDNSEE